MMAARNSACLDSESDVGSHSDSDATRLDEPRSIDNGSDSDSDATQLDEPRSIDNGSDSDSDATQLEAPWAIDDDDDAGAVSVEKEKDVSGAACELHADTVCVELSDWRVWRRCFAAFDDIVQRNPHTLAVTARRAVVHNASFSGDSAVVAMATTYPTYFASALVRTERGHSAGHLIPVVQSMHLPGGTRAWEYTTTQVMRYSTGAQRGCQLRYLLSLSVRGY